MELSRRDFLKLSGVGTGGFFLYSVFKQDKALASPKQLPLKKKIGEKTTICPYCGVGCSAIMAMENGKIINLEGDPDSPINEGSLCPKGASLYQVANNEDRLTTVKHRSPGATWYSEEQLGLSHIAKELEKTNAIR